jgi:ABC-type nitrate/sulfonate/bicarbonate transport system permease component
VWELYTRLAALPVTILPAPSRILTAGLAARGLLVWHASQTLVETLAGFALAVVVAVVCAAAIDFFVFVRRALLPLLVISQTIPIVALAPLLVLWFGYGALPKVLVVALVCFFPMVVATSRGLSATDAELVKLYRTFGASRGQIFRRVRLPTALPSFFSGVRIAITYSVVGAIFGEYVGAAQGLGIYLQTAKNSYRTDLVFAVIAMTALMSLALFGLAIIVERLVIPGPAPRAASRVAHRAIFISLTLGGLNMRLVHWCLLLTAMLLACRRLRGRCGQSRWARQGRLRRCPSHRLTEHQPHGVRRPQQGWYAAEGLDVTILPYAEGIPRGTGRGPVKRTSFQLRRGVTAARAPPARLSSRSRR